MIKNKLFFSFLLLLLLIGCKNSGAELKNFTYTFSMESPQAFKMEFQLNPDSTYQIRQYNYFFDNFEGTQRPSIKDGKLTAKEFADFGSKLAKTNIEKMKDAYGFDTPDSDNFIVYIVHLQQGGVDKYVSISESSMDNFSADFVELINYTNKFIASKVE